MFHHFLISHGQILVVKVTEKSHKIQPQNPPGGTGGHLFSTNIALLSRDFATTFFLVIHGPSARQPASLLELIGQNPWRSCGARQGADQWTNIP